MGAKEMMLVWMRMAKNGMELMETNERKFN